MDNIILLSILLVFLAALVGSVLQHRRLDRVLKDLRGFHVTVQLADKRIWGKFKLYANALELLYQQPYTNRRSNTVSSYIVFNEQVGEIESIFRFHDELSADHQVRRLTEIEKAKNPRLWSRMKRSMRNFMVAFREAIDESIGLLMSRVQKNAASSLLKGQDSYLKKLGSNTIGMVSHSAYDPVLEHYIHQRVVLEAEQNDGQITEYVGVLKEYSSAWISLLDCHIDTEVRAPTNDLGYLTAQRKIDLNIKLSAQDDVVGAMTLDVRITNIDSKQLTVSRIEYGENFRYDIDVILEPGTNTAIRIRNFRAQLQSTVKLEDLPLRFNLAASERGDDDCPWLPELTLVFNTVGEVDVFLPRERGWLRHASG